MGKQSTTSILIRVQARGGRFLGSIVGGAQITVRDARTGQLLTEGVTDDGDSGAVRERYVSGASSSAIVTPGPSPSDPVRCHWVEATEGTAKFVAEMDLEKPTLLELSIYGPLRGVSSVQRLRSTFAALPGRHVGGAGLVAQLPGLMVEALPPPGVLVPGAGVRLRARVATMCGAPVAEDSLWPPSAFEVIASVRNLLSDEHVVVPLELEEAGVFGGLFTPERAGSFEATVHALQPLVGNSGSAQMSFVVESRGR